ncbi:uncharacterized protein PODANS_3_8370 [Podospora anserina S mat+]|uniref:DNA-directed RNA polymerase III subunit RPC9 n=1 Tax=Podospora anserina (strain S / ATCC MYA-4624 / DSM 980 / FGSC 10383) TaxID=515849 RepID=B2B094_PODAN|nr:uncharacterized protein PODANS_3_8370 [Podospora anserina S mat+]CAP70775.1 unnamed protein product [Podospora anserina S mat+]CDP27368.1 Putative DNA-directed RNA polymerase III subunit [Podospora anserina S mat+]
MKILEAQSAVLTNYEVYQHLTDIRKRNNSSQPKRRMPEDAFRLSKEVLEYLETKPYPLHDQKEKQHYSQATLELLCEKLAEKFPDITKAEGLAIFDVRPTNIPVLAIIVESLEDRYTEEEQQQLVDLVIEVLGQDDPEPEEEEGEEGAEDGDAVQSVETANGA